MLSFISFLPLKKAPFRVNFFKVVLCISLGLLLAGCEIWDNVSGEFKSTYQSQEDQECPQLDSQLYQLTKSENPLNEAKELGFTVKEDKIQVLLILATEETALPKGFDLDVGIRSGAQVQVFALTNDLCELANTDEIIAIYPPDKAVPD